LPTSAREQLGSRLRDLRLRAGLSGDALAARLGLTQSKISRVETGRSLPNLGEVRKWAAATKASNEELRELASLVEQVATTTVSWRILHQLGLAEKQREIADLERHALHIQTFQPTMIPGLLQTADYARHVIELAYQPGNIAQAVAARVDRQTVLYDTSKRFDFLLTEGALKWEPGTVMDAQRDRLQSVSTMPNVTLSVTTAAYPYLHPFVIWQLEDETLVTVETYSAELQVRETEDVERYFEVWRRLSDRARRLY
jgi:transcriptional regulator with XRE-family HTH domain